MLSLMLVAVFMFWVTVAASNLSLLLLMNTTDRTAVKVMGVIVDGFWWLMVMLTVVTLIGCIDTYVLRG